MNWQIELEAEKIGRRSMTQKMKKNQSHFDK